MEPFSIRELDFKKEKHIADELMELLHESEKGMNQRTANWKRIRKNYLKHIKECIKENQGVFLIAEINNSIIGFIFGYVDEKDDSDFEGGEGEDLYVSEGYVKPEYRKMGVYSALNVAFEAHYRKISIRRIYRYTLVNNTVMQNWLQKQGYTPVRIVYEK